MRAIVIDDNAISLEILELQLKACKSISYVEAFTSANEALCRLSKNDINVIFCDIIMPEMTGIEFATKAKEINGNCKIIFCSTSDQFAMDAFRVHANGYLTKPVSVNSIEAEMANLRIQSAAIAQQNSQQILSVRCFGNFEAFDAADLPISFRYKKTKELLAYLIHRVGAVCTTSELCGILFEDRPENDSLRSQIRNLKSDLTKSLKSKNLESVIHKDNFGIAAIPSRIECDYYQFRSGEEEAKRLFAGEYMSQYSWAEETAGYITAKTLE